jgi:hypothetical protein
MSFLSGKHLSRRTVLKGAGATIALPLLDAMIPAGTAFAQTLAASTTRLGFIYFPHGALQDQWQPTKTGRDFEFPFIIQPLEPFREYVTVVSGLRNKGGESSSPHGIIEETWLNCVSPRRRDPKTGVGVTVDQIAAKHLGKDTSLPSLELCGEPGGMISFRTPGQPLPMESNPRKAFYGMFGQGDTAQEREAILSTTGSLLDYVRDATASLNKKLDAGDRARVNDYLDSVREIEGRVQKLEANAKSLRDDIPGAPLGPPEDFGELLDIQFEMIALSWQTNRTRVATLKMVEEASMRTYPNLDVHEAFHPTSHWGGFPTASPTCGRFRTTTPRCSRSSSSVSTRCARATATCSTTSHHPVRQQQWRTATRTTTIPRPQALIGRGGVGSKETTPGTSSRHPRTRTSLETDA